MENFTYCTPTRYIFGLDAEQQTGSLMSQTGATHILIVYGGGSVVRSGLLQRVKNSLSEAGIAFMELGGIQPNPTDVKVREGIELCRRHNIDGVLGVGGGSSIDTAKAIAAGAVYNGDFWDFYCGKEIITSALPIGVVLTIAAAGSEGSGNSVITKTPEMIKLSLRTDYWLRPRFAVMNPALTETLPPYQTACGITDMMAHIQERYFSPTDNVEITDRLCEGALMAIVSEAPKVMANPHDYQARANIMWSGTVAHNGMCGVGRREDWTSHFIEHEISAMHPEVAHGAGLAVVFPAWLTFMADHKPAKVAQYARRVWGVDGIADDRAAALEGVARLKKFLASIGMPLNFAQLGIEKPEIDEMVRRLHINKGITIGAYYPLSAADTTAIYHLML